MIIEKKTWVSLEKEVRYENPWIEVVHHRVNNPVGNEGIYGVVNFKNIATGIIPLDNELNTWLVGQYRLPLEAYSWEIPEGGCPLGESILKAAQRELREETGITAQKWTEICKVHTSNSVCNEVGYIFLAEDLTLGLANPEETEDLQIQKVSLKKALDMVMDNQITDSISIAGILKACRIKGVA